MTNTEAFQVVAKLLTHPDVKYNHETHLLMNESLVVLQGLVAAAEPTEADDTETKKE